MYFHIIDSFAENTLFKMQYEINVRCKSVSRNEKQTFLFSSGNSFCIVTGSPAKIPETIEKLGLTPVVTLKIQRLFKKIWLL